MVGQKWWEEKPEPEVGKWSEKEVRTPHLRFLLDKFFSFGHRCGWHGANSLSKNQTEPVFLTTQNVRTKSPLAQVGLKRCDLVTDKRLGVADTSEPWWPCSSFFFIYLFFFKIYLSIYFHLWIWWWTSFISDCSAAISFCFVSGSQKDTSEPVLIIKVSWTT